MFTIVVNEKFAGGCGLYNIDRKMKTAEFGRILISENARGGTGQAVIESVIAVAREELGINRIYLEVKKNNSLAIRAYKKTGFSLRNREDGMDVIFMEVVL